MRYRENDGALIHATDMRREDFVRHGYEIIPLYANPKPNPTADASKKVTPLAQRKIQSVIDSGEYREMEGATVLVSEEGHTAIVNPEGAFYWVDNEYLAREFYDAETKGKGNE